MGFDEACGTGLDLSLGYQDKPPDHAIFQVDLPHQNKKKVHLKYDHLLPSLTLGPSSDASKTVDADDVQQQLQEQASSPCSGGGAISSFSNSSSFKRDRDFGGEEVEVEVEEDRALHEHDHDQDHDEGSPRKKLRLSKEQSATLEDSFKEHSTLNPNKKQELARRLNLRPRQVEVWFQNRRARTKLKQTEADCELLKKCCETLKKENRRLHKELQELKLMKQTPSLPPPAPPFYMQFPTANLTMCPSCDKICNSVDHHNNHGSSTCPFLTGSNKSSTRHLIFNTHPSTAC